MLDPLVRTERLLRDYGHVYQANLAAIALGLFRRDPAAACRAISSGDWWDGSESVAAIDLAVDGGFTAQAREDALALRQALVEIFKTMSAYGEQNTAAEIVVAQFEKWRESHI
jgi:hypothetical protein